MATSRWGRFFGRGEQESDTTPPAYTGIGAPRPYDPPPGSPGPGAPAPAPTRQMPPAPARVPGPRSAPSPYEYRPVVTRAQYEQAARQRRDADQKVGVFERFDAKLTAQIHEATEAGRNDYVRELVSRRISVRSRLEEATLRRNRLVRTEEELAQGLDAQEAAAPGRW
jgi:hypothetical protein